MLTKERKKHAHATSKQAQLKIPLALLPSRTIARARDASQIFSNLVRKNIEGFVEYVEGKPLMVKNMIGAYGNTDIALHGGAMLRECIRYENLARMTLYDDTLWLFFDQVSQLTTNSILEYAALDAWKPPNPHMQCWARACCRGMYPVCVTF